MEILLTVLRDALIPLLSLIVLPILLMLLKRGLNAFEQKTGLEVNVNQQRMLEELVTKAIAYAEEQARKAAGGDKELKGEDKLKAALDFAKSAAKMLGLEVDGDTLAKLIEARLFQERGEE
jgi:hypothetical protein